MLKAPGKTPIFAWHDEAFISPGGGNEKQETYGHYSRQVYICKLCFAQVAMEQLKIPVHPQTILDSTFHSEELPMEVHINSTAIRQF